MNDHHIAQQGNPSSTIQRFHEPRIEVLCSHFWRLRRWRHSNRAFPYWRIYWNRNSGGSIALKSKRWPLDPEHILLIPPNTPFSTQLESKTLASARSPDLLIGGPVKANMKKPVDEVDHLFIHFAAGQPYDSMKPGVFCFELDHALDQLIHQIASLLSANTIRFNHSQSFLIDALILNLLARIDESQWPSGPKDWRIRKVLLAMKESLGQPLTNRQLAQVAKLSTNAFVRLFSQQMNVSPQAYLMEQRLEKACILLHHTEKSIEAIAMDCGFCDRNYFSRMFKKGRSMGPATYRKTRNF